MHAEMGVVRTASRRGPARPCDQKSASARPLLHRAPCQRRALTDNAPLRAPPRTIRGDPGVQIAKVPDHRRWRLAIGRPTAKVPAVLGYDVALATSPYLRLIETTHCAMGLCTSSTLGAAGHGAKMHFAAYLAYPDIATILTCWGRNRAYCGGALLQTARFLRRYTRPTRRT